MEKRCSLGLFSFAIFLAFDPAFAPKAFGVTENGNPLIRKSFGDPLLTVNSNRILRQTASGILSACTAVSVENKDCDNHLLDRRTAEWK